MRGVIAVLVLASCSGQTAKPIAMMPTAGESQPPRASSDPRIDPGIELDYDAPFRATPIADADYREGAARATACLQGDRKACLHATPLPEGSLLFSIVLERIHANCKAGDELSCRWSNFSTSSFSNAELRRGCAAGVIQECIDLEFRVPGDADSRFIAEQQCVQSPKACTTAAAFMLHRDPRDPIGARNLLEKACQRLGGPGSRWDRMLACDRLSMAYEGGAFPEPVSGRGRALREFVCSDPVGSELCQIRGL